jgi:hypothetical protein
LLGITINPDRAAKGLIRPPADPFSGCSLVAKATTVEGRLGQPRTAQVKQKYQKNSDVSDLIPECDFQMQLLPCP